MAKEVERTKPGSKLDWRVTYDSGNKKWTNDRPGDGKGDPDAKENLFDDLRVKRGIDRLQKAISGYADGSKGTGDIKKAVEQLELYAGIDIARTVVRALYKAVNGKDGESKITEGAGIAKDHVNRGRKEAAMNEARELLKIARMLVADRLKDEIGINSNLWYRAVQSAIEKWLNQNDYLGFTITVDYDTDPQWRGKYLPQTMIDPAEYPEVEDVNLDISSIDLEFKKPRRLMLRDLIELAIKLSRATSTVDMVMNSRAAMRATEAAVNKWKFDLVDTPVDGVKRYLYDLPGKTLYLTAYISGDEVEFELPPARKSDFEDKIYEIELEKAEEAGPPSRDDYY